MMEQPNLDGIPFRIISNLWKSGDLVPFLGAAASFAGIAPGAVALPSGRGFAKTLADDGDYPGDETDPLTKIAQYVEDNSARTWLLRQVYATFESVFEPTPPVPWVYDCALTRFLHAIPAKFPRLIVTTNYDTILERVFEQDAIRARGVRYVSISHIMPGTAGFGRLLCYTSLTEPPEKLVLSELNRRLREEYRDYVIIYKMHGSSHSLAGEGGHADSVVLTETDYVKFLEEDLLNRVPHTIIQRLQSSHLLFLGYSLEDWNFRVLLQRLKKLQTEDRQHWAMRLYDATSKAAIVEQKFWAKRNVDLHNVDLQPFLETLAERINAGGP